MIAILAVLLLSSAGLAKDLIVYLRFAPQESLNSDPPKLERASASRPFQLGEIADGRPVADRSLISPSVGGPVVRSSGAVSEFVTSSLKTCFEAWGLPMSTDAEVVLKGTIAAFSVSEENRYNGDVNIRFRLEDRGGQILWEGIAVGHASTWGRSQSAANYNQVLSDAMRMLAADLAGNAGFQSAWAGQSPTSSSPVMSSSELKRRVLTLMKEGLGKELLVSFVKSRRLPQPLSSDEILEWRHDGINDEVIRAALPESRTKD